LIVGAVNSSTDASSSVGYGSARSCVIFNPSAQDVWLSGVTPGVTATSYQLKANATVSLNLRIEEAVYGQGLTASPVVHFIQSGA
jgi:hypothetical protein